MPEITASTGSHVAVGALMALATVSTATPAPRIVEMTPVVRRLTVVAPSITNITTFPRVRELRAEDFAVLTADDIAMLEAVANFGSDDLDYSDLLLSDDE